MEWNDLKPGMIIKWKPYFARDFDPIIILIEDKYIDQRYYESFNTQILSGTAYSAFEYCHLLTSLRTIMGYTRIYKYNFEKNKENIFLSTSEDKQYIDIRMQRHVNSYKIEYENQKIWAKELMKKVNKFYGKKSK